MRILLINGPNLNLLGTRRPEIYGDTTLGQLEELATGWAQELDADLETFQSNHEGALIDRIHAARDTVDVIVINPGAYTHTSYAIHDALEAVELPTVEVHISNIHERESWRARSVTAPACVHQIYGRGVEGYLWAIRHLVAGSRLPAVRHTYGTDPQQFFDFRRADSDQLAILIHGGFWRHTWGFDSLDLNAVDLAQRGWNVASIEYRRVGNGGGWPTTRQDVIEAIESAISQVGLPVSRLSLIGHSAGGQLALEVAREMSLEPIDVVAVSMGGVNDMVTAVETDLGDGATRAYLEGADPRISSPFHNPPTCEIVIAHGTDDDKVPISYGRDFADAHGTTLLETSGGDHFRFLEPEDEMWTSVMDAITPR